MKKSELLKIKMTLDELSEVFAANYPWLVPNNSNVGRFAKKLGYVKAKQMTNYKMQYFYVKADQ